MGGKIISDYSALLNQNCKDGRYHMHSDNLAPVAYLGLVALAVGWSQPDSWPGTSV